MEEAEWWVAASLAVAECQVVVAALREEGLSSCHAAAPEFLAALHTREGDVARREEEVMLREVDAAAREESLAGREQVSATLVDEIHGVGGGSGIRRWLRVRKRPRS